MIDSIPYLPENAPFTAEQRAYLNGFLAGLFSRTTQPAGAPVPMTEPERLRPLTILFGSQTGTAEQLAKRLAKEAGKRGFAAIVHDLGAYSFQQLAAERDLLLLTSTFGDGDPPDNARSFWNALSSEAAPQLPQLNYSVLAL
ncbi:MAG: flavodoxin domain-containing protein, partial [Verrucomicrobiota bacterium]